MSIKTLIPETLKDDMLEFWDDEDNMLPVLEKTDQARLFGRNALRKKERRDS